MDSTAWLLSFSIFSMSAAILVGVGYVIYRKMKKVNEGDSFQESMFERKLTRDLESQARSINRTDVPVLDGSAVAPLAPVITALPISGVDSPILTRLIARLQAGGTMTRYEGPVRSSREDLKGALVELSGGRKVAILEEGLDRTDPVLEALLRFHDGVIMPGPGETFIFVERLENLIAAHITVDRFGAGA